MTGQGRKPYRIDSVYVDDYYNQDIIKYANDATYYDEEETEDYYM
jgi:hypothetical protein